MTLKGALRSAAAAQRRVESEARRRQRELERQQKQLAKMQEQEQAAYEVAEYEAYLESPLSIHKARHDLGQSHTKSLCDESIRIAAKKSSFCGTDAEEAAQATNLTGNLCVDRATMAEIWTHSASMRLP